MPRFSAAIGGFDEATRSVPVVASTPDPVDGEALISFDLERFIKNPVILWCHDATQPAVGRAENVRQTENGLEMTIVFATAAANPLGEMLWQQVREGILRTVSVGYDPGDPVALIRDGKPVIGRENNHLCEVSFTPVPLDENAGTPALGAGDARAKMDRRELDELGADVADHFDAAGLSKVEWTAQGYARIKAKLSRVGVLQYAKPSPHAELRKPEHVFRADSLATLKGVPVIDFVHHTKLHGPQDWQKVAIGHVEDVHIDGDYIAGTLLITHADALDNIRAGTRLDISAGYQSRNVAEKGTWRGQPYDEVQQGIVYNHVALCPPGGGRAGRDVALTLDRSDEGVDDMTTAADNKTATKTLIKLDGKDYEQGSEAHINKLEQMAADAGAAAKKQLDTLQAKLDASEEALKKAKLDAAEAEKKSGEDKKAAEETFAKRMQSKFRLWQRAMRLFGKDDEDDSEEASDDDKKMDALDAKIAEIVAMSDRDLMVKAIKSRRPKFDATDRTDDYVAARFDSLLEEVQADESIHGVVRHAEEERTRLDASDRSAAGARKELQEARERREKARREGWKTPVAGK